MPVVERSPAAAGGWKKTLRRALLLALGCGWFIFLVVRIGVSRILTPLREIGWDFLLIAAVYVVYELVRALAYWVCVTVSGPCSYWDLLRFRLSGEAVQFLTSTGPFLAEPAKMWLLRKQGFSGKQSVAATLTEYLIYTFSSAALAAAGLALLLEKFQLSAPVKDSAVGLLLMTIGFLGTAAWAIAARFYLIGTVIKWIRAIPFLGKRLSFPDEDVRQTEDLLFVVFRGRPMRFIAILAIEFASQALLVLELYVLLAATHQPFSMSRPFLIEGATKFIGLAFFFIPGQVGAAEGIYALIFGAMGLPVPAGLALAVARRVRTIIAAGFGLALVPLWGDRSRRA